MSSVFSDTDRTVNLEGVTLHLAHPDEIPIKWVGQDELVRQLQAAWLTIHEQDVPMTPRLLGKPGVGKTTLAYATAKKMSREVYIMQATLDTRPEDLLVTPVIEGEGRLRYVASPLVTAMIRGGVCVLDEGNRMSEKSWASLAPLLDHRRYVESIVAGVTVAAHPDFRCCVTMNDDASTYEVPDYILSRLQPTLPLEFPDREDEMAILRYHLPFAADEMLAMTVDFLQEAHDLDLDYSPRDGIHILQYAIKRLAQVRDHPLSQDEAWSESLLKVLGEEALDLEGLVQGRQQALGDEPPPMDFGDIFFGDDSPLHPDR